MSQETRVVFIRRGNKLEDTDAARVQKKTKWNVQKRLEFIEFRLFWDGRLNRKDLVETFEISAQQASTDMATYKNMAPENFDFDSTQKSYLRSNKFSAKLIGSWTNRYLLQLLAVESGWMDAEQTWFQGEQAVEVTTLARKRVDSEVVMNILDGIREARQVEMFYHSMTGTPASQRRIEPHALTYNSGSWYVRAWSSEHNEFRDYNLNRIKDAIAGGAAHTDRSLDFQWHHTVDLIITPNPDLPPEKQAAVEYEYEMVDGRISMNCRLSVSFYLMSEYNLDVEPGKLKPVKQQLVLENKEDVVQARDVAQKLSIDALNRVTNARDR